MSVLDGILSQELQVLTETAVAAVQQVTLPSLDHPALARKFVEYTEDSTSLTVVDGSSVILQADKFVIESISEPRSYRHDLFYTLGGNTVSSPDEVNPKQFTYSGYLLLNDKVGRLEWLDDYARYFRATAAAREGYTIRLTYRDRRVDGHIIASDFSVPSETLNRIGLTFTLFIEKEWFFA